MARSRSPLVLMGVVAAACSVPTEPTTTGASPITSAAASASAPAAARVDPMSGAAILLDAKFLASEELRGRGAGTEDEARAAKWIADQLERIGAPAPALGRVHAFEYGSGPEKSANVLAVISPDGAPAKGAVVLLGAHYDHLGRQADGTYYGAEDNASGVAVLLAIARELTARRGELVRPVVFAFFGAEEVGLRGSYALAGAWPHDEQPIAMMVNVDMIGRPLVDQPLLWLGAKMFGVLAGVDKGKAVGALLPPDDASLAARVRAACEAEGVVAVTPQDLPESLAGAVARMARGRGDHYPFERRGVPFVFFSSGESSDYHALGDTADKLDAAILERRARAILRFVLAESKRTDGDAR